MHTSTHRRFHIGRAVVNKNASFRRQTKPLIEGVENIVVGLQLFFLGGNHQSVKARASGDPVEIPPKIHAGIAEQVDAIALVLQLPHQLPHSLHGFQQPLPPGGHNILHHSGKPLGETAAYLGDRLPVGNGAMVQLNPLHTAKELPGQEAPIFLRKIVGRQNLGGIPMDQHLTHIKHNGGNLFMLHTFRILSGHFPQFYHSFRISCKRISQNCTKKLFFSKSLLTFVLPGSTICSN